MIESIVGVLSELLPQPTVFGKQVLLFRQFVLDASADHQALAGSDIIIGPLICFQYTNAGGDLLNVRIWYKGGRCRATQPQVSHKSVNATSSELGTTATRLRRGEAHGADRRQ